MRLRHELVYDSAADEVLAMLQEPSFWERVAAATDALTCRSRVDRGDAVTTVVVDQQQAVAGVPSFARKFVGDSTQAIKTTTWTGPVGTLEIQTPGKPTHLSGTTAVEERGAGSAVVYDVEVTASVPLVGGKLEKLVAELTVEGFDKEQSVGTAWLAGER